MYSTKVLVQFIMLKKEVQIQSNSLLRNIAPSRYTPTPLQPILYHKFYNNLKFIYRS